MHMNKQDLELNNLLGLICHKKIKKNRYMVSSDNYGLYTIFVSSNYS